MRLRHFIATFPLTPGQPERVLVAAEAVGSGRVTRTLYWLAMPRVRWSVFGQGSHGARMAIPIRADGEGEKKTTKQTSRLNVVGCG